MQGAITKFLSAAQWRPGPVHRVPLMKQRLTYIGVATLERCDGQTLLIDMYMTTTLSLYDRWYPILTLAWHDGDYAVSMGAVSADDDCTPNQVALKFLRDYIKNNWWELVSEPGFQFDRT